MYEGKVDLLFADPPFNVGENYGDWDDRMSRYEYMKFFNEWISLCARALRPGGTIWINVPDREAFWVHRGLDMHKCPLRKWVIWHYRFGQHNDGNFISSHTHLFYAVRDEGYWANGEKITVPYTWNPEEILVPSDRATKYNDPRTRGKKKGQDGMRVPFDVWDDIPRVTGNSKERIPERPNQLPERLLARIIRSTSNPGDIVLDPFGGTGTTLVVARALGRRAVTCEVDRSACDLIVRRAKKGAVNV